MGFKVGNLTFRYNVPAFGLSQACYLFTKVMNQPAKALRLRGAPISDYIDDGLTAAATYGRCLLQVLTAVRLLGSLGAFIGIPKSQLNPERNRQWLGFLIDTEACTFRLAPKRVAKLKRQLQETLDSPQHSPRRLASVAGRIVSASPAVLPASLFSRPFFQALHGHVGWDVLFPTDASVRAAATFWLTHLDAFNGRPWWPRPVALSAEVDASGLGFGGEIRAAGLLPQTFRGTFSPDEAAQSSALREMIGYLGALRAAAALFPDALRNGSLLITGDSQAAIACITNLRSSNLGISDLLRQLFDICLAASCDVQARWVPRANVARADALSREPDATDWALAPSLVREVFAHFRVQPALDLFASGACHVVPRYVTAHYEPGCTAVQALRLDWRSLTSPGDVVWLFPPITFTGQVLARLEQFRVDALLVMRSLRQSNEWLAALSLPSAQVSPPFVIPKQAASCIPSMRVPENTLNPAFLGLAVLHISWKE